MYANFELHVMSLQTAMKIPDAFFSALRKRLVDF